VSLSALPTRY